MTVASPFRIELLDKQDRTTFECGTEQLNTYLQKTASQDMRRGLARCFVAIDISTGALAGYYTLSATTVALHDLPKGNFGRYENVPAALLGRLAVDLRFQSQGLGRTLLLDAMRQMSTSAVAAAVIAVEAKDDHAAEFYRHCGFRTFASSGKHFFLPVQDIRRLFPPG